MKTQIENHIYNDRHFDDINAIIAICTLADDENEIRHRIQSISDWQTDDLQFGFGHNHFWLEERHGSDGFKRILYVDFTQ